MVCAVCNKESNNRRVCPYCFTPYPPNAPQSRPSTGTARQPGAGRPSSTGMKAQPAPAGNDLVADVRAFVMRQSPVVRWSALGIVLVLVVWMAIGGGDDGKVTFEAGSVPSDIIATPMQKEEALSLIKHTRETALVDMQTDEVFVSYPAATFPLLEEGQIALAQQFARADEIVEGRRRRIFFYNPTGRIFAQADGVTGVTVVK